MKYSFWKISLFLLLSALGIQSCCGGNDDEIIAPPQFVFTISNDSGNLFLTPNTYTIDSVKIFEQEIGELAFYNFNGNDGKFTLDYQQGINLDDNRRAFTYYIEFVNTDIDTLTFEEVRNKEKCGGTTYELENVKFNNSNIGGGSPYTTEFDLVKD